MNNIIVIGDNRHLRRLLIKYLAGFIICQSQKSIIDQLPDIREITSNDFKPEYKARKEQWKRNQKMHNRR